MLITKAQANIDTIICMYVVLCVYVGKYLTDIMTYEVFSHMCMLLLFLLNFIPINFPAVVALLLSFSLLFMKLLIKLSLNFCLFKFFVLFIAYFHASIGL